MTHPASPAFEYATQWLAPLTTDPADGATYTFGGASDVGLPDGAVYGPAPDAAVTVLPEWWRS